jgi:hypothetical protein
MVHACNPSYLGGWDQKDHCSRAAQANSWRDPHLQNNQSKMDWRCGSSSRASTCFPNLEPWVWIPVSSKTKRKTNQPTNQPKKGKGSLLWFHLRLGSSNISKVFVNSKPGLGSSSSGIQETSKCEALSSIPVLPKQTNQTKKPAVHY